MIKSAVRHNVYDAATPFVDVIELVPGYQSLRVRGNVPPHTDRAFPEWVYMLGFRAEDAVMHSHGHAGTPLTAGTILEFNEHRRHRVEQDKDSIMIWTPLEVDQRLSLEEALEGHRRQFKERGSILLKGVAKQEIVTKSHRIVHDGRITHVYDSAGFCIAFFYRAGFALCRRIGKGSGRDSVEYPMLTMRRPRPDDWKRMADLLWKFHGMRMPKAAMPKWLDGRVDAHS